jgi:hypothetical protein
MSTVAYPGYGSKLEISGSPKVRVAQIRKFNFPGLKADFEEISNLDSPSVFKEYMKLMIDGGDMPFDGVLDPGNASVASLWTSLQTAGSAALETFIVTLTDGSTLTFDAYVSQFSLGAEYNKVIAFTASLKIVGNVAAVWA